MVFSKFLMKGAIDMDDDFGSLIGILLILGVVLFIVYCIVIIASIIASLAGIGGMIWGGGTAILNYGQSFKENMIDSNLATA